MSVPPMSAPHQVEAGDGALAPRAGAVGASSKRPAAVACLALALGLVALFLAGYLPRRARREQLEASARTPAREALALAVVHPKRLARRRALRLPATIEANEQTVVYARANGYVRRRLVNLGARVRAHELLAELDTPELDRELEQARARVAQSEAAIALARAAREFTRSSLQRYELLSERRLTSRQELEQVRAEARVNDAKVQVAEAEQGFERANLRRLEQLKAFAQVLAPFTGVVTSRTVERGSLVMAGLGSPLFEIAAIDPLRVAIDVPQSWVAGVQTGLLATLTVAEYPERTFAAEVARSAGRLEANTRTMRVELTVPNADARLLPGMYATVELALEAPHELFSVPASAVLMSKDGPKAAVLGADGLLHFKPLRIERDNGAEIEIAAGLGGDESLIANPGAGLVEGTPVRPTS